ncbi:MAG: lysophospholipid acyltransferase family protein [Candidatus Marinimicrobia bacterium]|nr:lysophospholipid acyltransferase family protein [Candidatus Neomarinimicrobiota bacterium]MDP7071322.1 lysophospholipid acyltransferase family protein [Candidatus Neomarinimicrobiota bacterium]
MIWRSWLLLNIGVWTGIFGSIGIIGSLLEKNKGGFMGHIAKWWGKTLLAVCGIRYSVKGLSHIHPQQEYIFAANHESSLDIPLVFAAIPKQLVPVSKIELKKIPIMGWGMSLAGHIFVDRSSSEQSMKSIQKARESLNKFPRSVIIFPEGTRSIDGKMKPFKRGGLLLAIETGIPVLPVAICGTINANKKGSYNITKHPVELRCGSPINSAEYSIEMRKEFVSLIENSVRDLKNNATRN